MRAATVLVIGLFVLLTVGPLTEPARGFHARDAPCQCLHRPMGELIDEPDFPIFVGRVTGGTSVRVDAWFHGRASAATVRLDPAGFGRDRTRCELDPFPLGSRWIFVAERAIGADKDAPLLVSSCQRHARVNTAEGQAMLTEAFAAFGEPETLGDPVFVARPRATEVAWMPWLVVGLALMLGLGMFVIAVTLVRRSAGRS